MNLAASLLLVLFTSPLLAAEPAAKDSKDTDYVVTPKNVVQTDSSEHNRIDKTHQVNLILFGVGPSVSSTTGLQYGYFLKRNKMLVLEATTGKLGFGNDLDTLSGYDFDLKTKSVGLHFKHFNGNSFYYRLGVDLRTVDYSYANKSDTNNFVKFKGSSLAANLQIGNQWQWDNFTLGCDWLGLSLPITSSVRDSQVGSSTPSNVAGFLNSDSDTFVKSTHLNLLRFYLGASF